MQDVMIYPKVKSIVVDSCVVTKSAIPLGPGKDYGKLLSTLLNVGAKTFNLKFRKGVSLGDIFGPEVAMIGGLLKNITLSPYVADGWMYGGFSMFADQPYNQVQV